MIPDLHEDHDRRWWILVVLCLSLVMVILGNTVLNVVIPTLVRELDATASELQWMVDAYALIFAGLLLTCGALGPRFPFAVFYVVEPRRIVLRMLHTSRDPRLWPRTQE